MSHTNKKEKQYKKGVKEKRGRDRWTEIFPFVQTDPKRNNFSLQPTCEGKKYVSHIKM
jgi:hypothetical protein